MNPFGKYRAALVIAAVITGEPCAFAQVTDGAIADEATDKLTEITVTAQRREQNMQSVGTSVTAFDTSTLEHLGMHDVTDVVGQVPGLQYNQFGSTVTVYNLRGISQNDFSDHQEAPVAVYSDDAYIASTGALAGTLFDLQRVEVLRGPQGTLFGRNATGGLIQYVSNKPTDQPSAYVYLTGGDYDEFDTESVVNGPLGKGLSGRASFATSRHDGYIHNRIGHDIEDQDQYAGRLQLRYKPTDRLDLLLKIHGLTNNHETGGIYSWASAVSDATGRGVFTPGQPDANGYFNPSTDVFNQAEDHRGIFNRTVWGTTGTAVWTTDTFTLTSVSDYLRVQKRYGEDTDLSPNPVFSYDVFYHYQQFSQELRLSGTAAAGAMRWVGGAYYLNYRTTMAASTNLNPGYVPGIGRGEADFTLRMSSPAAFAQVEYDLAPSWTIIGGARYTYDRKTFDYLFDSLGSPDPSLQQRLHYSPATDPTARRDWNIVTGKLELDYKPAPDLLLYGSINRGAKGGGWSGPNVAPVDPAALSFDQERLTSYELGFKSTFWDQKARLNASIFDYDYRNYQGFFLNVATNVVENVNARVKGGELELALVPVRRLNLQLGLSHLETIVPHVPTPAGDVVRAQMPQAPHWSLNAIARYEWPMFDGQMSVEADGKYNSYQYLELINAPVDLQPGYATFNARVGFMSSDGKWDVDAFVRNLGDKIYRTYNLDLSAIDGTSLGVYGPPRTWGVTFRYRWGS